MNAGKHTEWVEFYKAALLEEDQEKLLQRIYLAVDAIRYRMWELLREEMRAAETCGLRITDLDMRGGVLSIQRLKGSLFTIQELERHRGVPLLDEVKALKEWLAVRPTDCGDALFTSQKGSHLTSTQFYRIFRQIARNAGLPDHKSHPHVLKHALATHMVRRDVNLAKVQRALGHRSINSTMAYVGVSDQEADAARHNALMNAF